MGELGGYPAHLAAYMYIWTTAYLRTNRPDVKDRLNKILHKALDTALARTEKYGFYPVDFGPEVEGKEPRKSDQSNRLAHHAVDLSIQLKQANRPLAAKLRKLAELHLGTDDLERAETELRQPKGPLGKPLPIPSTSEEKRPEVVEEDLAGKVLSKNYANAIRKYLRYFERYGDDRYLDAAERHARLASAMFCDGNSPLPRALAIGVPLRTPEGEEFPDFYFRGARLMHAFALLGEAKAKARE